MPLRSRLAGIGGTLALIGLFALVAVLVQPEPQVLAGSARASDGDSLRLNGERVRLLGIDAPELDQVCGGDHPWPCGRQAQEILAGLVAGSETSCESTGRDRYDRVLARCRSRGLDLGQAMVEAGFAIADGDYHASEATARASGTGIWSGPFDLPRDWRQTHGDTEPFDLFGWLKGFF